MREILFRGKRLDNGEWIEGYLVRTYLNTYIMLTRCLNDDLFFSPRNIFFGVDPATVGQFTGLTDKNGKRIFEGDIVRFRTRISTFKPLCVRWYEESCQFIVTTRDGVRSYSMDKSWEYEIIGNIHDNPELLNGGDAG